MSCHSEFHVLRVVLYNIVVFSVSGILRRRTELTRLLLKMLIYCGILLIIVILIALSKLLSTKKIKLQGAHVLVSFTYSKYKPA